MQQSYILYAIAWLIVLYFANCWYAGRFKKIKPNLLILYVTSVIFLGMYGEIFVDSLYNALFGQPLWEYRILPIYNGYTSYFSILVWGTYGFHLYLLHDTLHKYRVKNTSKLAAIIAVESLIFEMLANLTFIILFGEYIFYYLPGDLWHLTSVQAFPIYLAAAFVLLNIIKHFKVDRVFFTAMNLVVVSVLIMVA